MSSAIIETPTAIQELLSNNIKNSIDLLATQYSIEVKKLNMLTNIFVEITLIHKSLENPELKSNIETYLNTLFSEIQRTNKNVFLLSSIFFLIKYSSKPGNVEELKGGKMSGGNVAHFLIILMWILYGTYFLSNGLLDQRTLLSQDGNNEHISTNIPENILGESLYKQYGIFMENFATAYNSKIESNLRGSSLEGILKITLNNSNQTLTVDYLPNTFNTVYEKIIKDTEFETAKQNIIEKYIPTGKDLVAVLEDTALMGAVNTAITQISTIEITPATITSAAEKTLSVAQLASKAAMVVAKKPVLSTTALALSLRPALKELASKYNSMLAVVERAEKTVQETYDAAVQLIASNPKENIERLNQLKTQLTKHKEFVQQLTSFSNNLRGTVISAVKDLINDKPMNAPVAEKSNKITDAQINNLIKDINVNIFLFATNVSYEITKVTGSIIMNFCKNMIVDIYKKNFDSLIGAIAFLIPVIIYSGVFKIKSKKSPPEIENAPTPALTHSISKGGRKTKKPANLKKNKKTQKKNKYSRKTT